MQFQPLGGLAVSLLLAAGTAGEEGDVTKDLAKLQGTWGFTALQVEGSTVPEASFKDSRMVIEGDAFTLTSPEATYKGTLLINARNRPRTLDIQFTKGPHEGQTALGIYELDRDTWTICLGLVGKDRPKEFVSRPGSGHVLESLRRLAAEPRSSASAGPEQPREPAAADPDLEKVQGEWSMVSGERDGQALPKSYVSGAKRVAKGDETMVTVGGQVFMKAKVRLDSAKKPKAIDYVLTGGPNEGKTQLGIYELEGERLKFCFAEPGKERPTDFTAAIGSGRTLTVWKRAKQ